MTSKKPSIITTESLIAYFTARRQAILAEVDAIEKMLSMPRTSQIRKAYKENEGFGEANTSYTHNDA